MKRGIFLGFLMICLFLVSSFVSAENNVSQNISSEGFSLTKGFEWLNSKMQESNWGGEVDSVAWSILALKNGGYDISEGVERLKQVETSNNWDGKVYESAMATLALYNSGVDVSDEINWLKDQQKESLNGGDWLIQLLTDGESSCKIRYDGGDFEFRINGTEIIDSDDGCAVGENWINFENCIKQDDAGMYESFYVDCFGSSSVSPSLLFKRSNEYYIIDKENPLEVANACFYGQYSDCKCFPTQYASWVLNKVGENPLTIAYLRSNCNEGVQSNAFLYMLTGIRAYEENLVNLRETDGSWDGDIRNTVLGMLALRESSSSVTSSKDWLEFKQRQDGSWEDDVRTTAMVLYALTRESNVPVVINNANVSASCHNGVVDAGEDCEFSSQCPSINGTDYTCVECECVVQGECDNDLQCAVGEVCRDGMCVEDTSGCSFDSDCGVGEVCRDGECVSAGSSDECRYDSDCTGENEICEDGRCVAKEKGSFVTWLIVTLIVLLGLIGGYLGYKHKFDNLFKKKNKFVPPNNGETQTIIPRRRTYLTKQNVPVAQPSLPRQQPTVSKQDRMERQLDQALKKARDLLGKSE